MLQFRLKNNTQVIFTTQFTLTSTIHQLSLHITVESINLTMIQRKKEAVCSCIYPVGRCLAMLSSNRTATAKLSRGFVVSATVAKICLTSEVEPAQEMEPSDNCYPLTYDVKESSYPVPVGHFSCDTHSVFRIQ